VIRSATSIGRRPLRALMVVLAVLVLVPAWVARVAYVYACPSERTARPAHCCPTVKAKIDAERRSTTPMLQPACCDPDEVTLAVRVHAAGHDDPALAPPDRAVVAPAVAAPIAARRAPTALPPRATGPPIYLKKLALLC
jgi:hypothetical protein